MDEIKKLKQDIIRKVIIVDFLLVGLTVLVFDDYMPVIFGLIFGTAIGVLNFMQLSSTLTQAVKMDPTKAKGYTTSRYMIRYIITGVVLYVSVLNPKVHVIGTLIGLVLIKFVVLFTNLFNDKKYFKNIFRRREG